VAGTGVDHPPSSSAEVKQRVELYIYSSSRLLWHVTDELELFLLLPYLNNKKTEKIQIKMEDQTIRQCGQQ